MSLTGKIISRFKFELVGRIVATFSQLLLVVFLARYLDQDEYGLLFLAISIFAILRVFSKFGIARSGARYLTEYKEKDPTQIPNILKITLIYNLFFIFVVSLALFISHRHLAEWLNNPDLVPFLLMGVPFLIFGTLAFFVRIAYQAIEDIKLSAIFHSLERFSRLLFAVGFVLIGAGAIGALLGYILGYGLVVLVGIYLLFRRFGWSQKTGTVETELQQKIGKYTLPLIATGTANEIEKRIDIILVGFFLTPTAVSFYVVGKQIITLLDMPVSALGFTLSPTYSAEKTSGNIKRISRIYQRTLEHILILYIPAATGLIILAEPTLRLIFGSKYLGAVPLLQVLSIYAIFLAVMRITSTGLDYLGQAKARAVALGISAFCNLVLNIILIPTIGVVGAAIATVITYGIYTIINMYIINIEFELDLHHVLYKTGHTLVVTGILAIILLILRRYIDGWISFVPVILAGLLTWILLVTTTRLVDIAQLRDIVVN